MTPTRRTFLRSASALGAGFAFASLKDDWLNRVAAAGRDEAGRSPGETADHQSYWSRIQEAFDIDRSIVNLNNGGVSPSPRIVHEAMLRQLTATNMLPPKMLWTVQDPQVELVRTKLARTFGCDAEEMAITRNASESLQICLNGFDLKKGEEILTSMHDYPRMINTIKQRQLREGIVLRQVKLPAPAKSHDELYNAFAEGITPRTRLILTSHVVFLTGQIMPVQRICKLARERGIPCIVDGAHAFAHMAFRHDDLDCDYYGVSLHKWLTAPIGTGFLYVRKDKIKDLWPLTAPDDPKSENIRKFEEIGTHPDGPRLAIAEALLFYENIGPERKEARLRYLRDYWANRLKKHDRIRFHVNLSPEHSCAITTVGIEGVDNAKLVDHLWTKHKVFVTGIKNEDFEGIRVSPNVYTTLGELDLFCEAMEGVVKNGLSKT